MLNCIYEEEFLGFNYGFRPGHGQHDALDTLCVGITTKKVNFIFDADVQSFFGAQGDRQEVKWCKSIAVKV